MAKKIKGESWRRIDFFPTAYIRSTDADQSPEFIQRALSYMRQEHAGATLK